MNNTKNNSTRANLDAVPNLMYIIIAAILIFSWSSCRSDMEFSISTVRLEFSKDTVYLDTVFTNIGSSTYTLKVYNPSNENILIPSIKLGNEELSNYRLNVDGLTGSETSSGKVFENVELLARDSMYVFIETTVDIQTLVNNENQFLYEDEIKFGSGSEEQSVALITLVKDAYFIYPQRYTNTNGEVVTETLSFDTDGDGTIEDTTIQGRFLTDEELNFNNQKPSVIYGYAAVGSGKTLVVDAGARIHFHANSGLLITNNASIEVNGMHSNDSDLLEGEVIFEGDRLEPSFENRPGQWQTIWLMEGSHSNYFNYCTIKNGTVGVLSDGNPSDPNKLQINNSKIFNHSNFGILGRATSIIGENLVINNVGQSAFAGTYGGKYNISNSTLVNYWNNSFRQFPSVFLNNYIIDQEQTVYTNALQEANFTNCIIYGNDNPEIILDKLDSEVFNFKFLNCLIYFDDPTGFFEGDQYDLSNNTLYENVIINQDPLFLNPTENQLQIPEESPANGAGIPFGILDTDITNSQRGPNPDIGAYESINFN